MLSNICIVREVVSICFSLLCIFLYYAEVVICLTCEVIEGFKLRLRASLDVIVDKRKFQASIIYVAGEVFRGLIILQ